MPTANKCAFACCRMCGGWAKSDDHSDRLIPERCPRCGDSHMRSDWLKMDGVLEQPLPAELRRAAIRSRLCVATVDGVLVQSPYNFPVPRGRLRARTTAGLAG